MKWTHSQTLPSVGVPQYDKGGSLDTNKEKYVIRAFNFVEPVVSAGAVTKAYFTLHV
jgi:hypothetical protein